MQNLHLQPKRTHKLQSWFDKQWHLPKILVESHLRRDLTFSTTLEMSRLLRIEHIQPKIRPEILMNDKNLESYASWHFDRHTVISRIPLLNSTSCGSTAVPSKLYGWLVNGSMFQITWLFVLSCTIFPCLEVIFSFSDAFSFVECLWCLSLIFCLIWY